MKESMTNQSIDRTRIFMISYRNSLRYDHLLVYEIRLAGSWSNDGRKFRLVGIVTIILGLPLTATVLEKRARVSRVGVYNVPLVNARAK